MKNLRYLSLFSGIEAAGIWHERGWTCVGLAEIEPFPCKVLNYRYPGIPNLGSVIDITEAQIKALGHIDVIVFGAPCQDLSIAGKRKGFTNEDGTHTRSGLFFTALQIAEWSGARFAVYENVPGMFSSSKGADFAAVVGEMAGARFDIPRNGWPNTGVAVGQRGLVEWVTLDAQFIRTPRFPRAVPQRRRRVFVVRDSGDWASRPPLFLEPESLCGNPPPSRKAREVITHSVARGAAGGCGTASSDNSVAGTIGARTGLSIGAQDAACGHLLPMETVGALDTECGFTSQNHQSANAGHDWKDVSGVETHRMVAFGEYADDGTASAMKRRDYKDATDLVTFTLAGNTIGRQPETGGNGPGYDETGSSYTLTKTDVHAVAFSAGNSSAARGVGYSEEHTPPLRAGVSGTNMTQTIAFTARDYGNDASTCVAPTMRSLACGADGHQSGGHGLAIAFHVDAQPDEMNFDHHTSATLTKSQHATRMLPTMQVRRLTPVECARLQGFEDDWLSQVPGASDTAQYKALGNSMARNVMDYLGGRIDAVINNP